MSFNVWSSEMFSKFFLLSIIIDTLKNFFDQEIFADQLQLLDCEKCAKNEHPITKNGFTIPLSS